MNSKFDAACENRLKKIEENLMARQTSYQTLIRTYNPFSNFTVGETSQYVRSTITQIVDDDEDREIHLDRTSQNSHRHQDNNSLLLGMQELSSWRNETNPIFKREEKTHTYKEEISKAISNVRLVTLRIAKDHLQGGTRN